jgi:hypothetical protein
VWRPRAAASQTAERQARAFPQAMSLDDGMAVVTARRGEPTCGARGREQGRKALLVPMDSGQRPPDADLLVGCSATVRDA